MLKTFQKIIVCLLVCFSLFCIAHGLFATCEVLRGNLRHGQSNVSKGLPFTSPDGDKDSFVRTVGKIVPPSSSVFFWTISNLRKEISTECRVCEFNYRLYPTKFSYGQLPMPFGFDFVVCDKNLSHLAEPELFMYSFPFSYKIVSESNGVCVFKRNR